MEKGYAVLSVEHKVYVIVLCVSYDVFCFTFDYLFVIEFCIKILNLCILTGKMWKTEKFSLKVMAVSFFFLTFVAMKHRSYGFAPIKRN